MADNDDNAIARVMAVIERELEQVGRDTKNADLPEGWYWLEETRKRAIARAIVAAIRTE